MDRPLKAIIPLVMIGIGLLLIVSSVVWVTRSAALAPSAPASGGMESIPYPEIKRISVADAKAAFDLRQAIFVDVRGEPAYSEGHIPGALSIIESELPEHLKEFKPSDWIIPYCT